MRVFKVKAHERIGEHAFAMSSICDGFCSNMDPAPLLHIKSIGQPMFMSTKSIPPLCANSSSISCAHLDTASGYPPQICAPNTSSLACLRNSAHSEGWPCSKLVHSAISPQVMSAPNCFAIRRKGRLPTVVRGAR